MKKKPDRTRKTSPQDGLALMKEGVKQIEEGVKSMKEPSKKSHGKGLSLHIGVNELDPKCYPYFDPGLGEDVGWDGALLACEKDAKDMKKIADSQGFKSTILLTKKATVENVVNAMRKAAKELSSGDSFFITYSGHGGMVPDLNDDEADGVDETWCLYDRQFIDDELCVLYSEFKAGVNILVLSDSCHSGTVTRSLPRAEPALTAEEKKEIFGSEEPIFRLMTRETSMAVYDARSDFYDEIQYSLKRTKPEDIKANMRLISACQDDEEAADGMMNGKFTGVLKKVWANGRFEGGCKQFHAAIKGNLDAEYARVLKGRKKGEIEELGIQKPNYNAEGPDDDTMDKRPPFSI